MTYNNLGCRKKLYIDTSQNIFADNRTSFETLSPDICIYTFIDDKDLYDAEKILNLKIPEQYVWFLKNYGHGGLDGIETLGVGKNGKMIFVEKTLEFRSYGLNDDKIVIENCDEWIYCIDVKTGAVMMWSQGDKKYKINYKNFIEYLNDRISDAIENM